MRLYIKANSIKILKNLPTLLPNTNAKTAYLLNKKSPLEYQSNLASAAVLESQKEKLFFSDKSLSSLVKGIYFGNSSCEHLLPSIADIVEAEQLCKEKYYNFVFVFPPLGQHKMEEAQFILEHLSKKPLCEVVVNDIGTLHLALSYSTLKPILGLAFTKVIKNAFIDNITPTDLSSMQFEKQQALAKHCEFELAEVRGFYKAMGVGRFTIENTDLSVDFLETAPKMLCDFYYPYISLANSKACDIAGLFEDQRGYFVQEECPKYCNFVSLEFTHNDILGLHQRYNTINKTHTPLELNKMLYKENKNRLVWEVFL
jgi:hypothetical protein